MPLSISTIRSAGLPWLERNRGLLFPVAATSLILVLLVPLPLSLMDMLLVCNITIAAVVLLTTMYVRNPLELSVFPSLLLATTLFRLVLNTATTRLILTSGEHAQTAEGATAAAGKVIEAFGQFVAGDSLAVGFIIFLILVIIQFVVITKGATRISEVAARFTLDGMPGKQMAIDADLNAGIISEQQARQRRENISREADFYGAMDGASKFVRGDAIAGLIITAINILGGLYVGMVEYGWDIGQCLAIFTKLTIGDGLVTQIPAFIISLSAGMIVTRSTAESNLGEELMGQLTSRPEALAMASGFLFMLAMTPLPTLPMLALAGSCGATSFVIFRKRSQTAQKEVLKQKEEKKAAAQQPEQLENLLSVDLMELEVGYGMIRMVDRKQGGDLLDRISLIRKQVAIDMGFIVPPIRIRDNVNLEPAQYAIKLKGVEIARGEAHVGHFMAIDSGNVTEQISGQRTTEPAFGLPALWISDADRVRAEHAGYTVVDASSVVATHLTEIIKNNAADLLTREQTSKNIEALKQRSPAVVDELIPDKLQLGQVQKILQNLLRERVPVRDLETILETVGDWIGRTKDLDVLTEYVRNALARTICAQVRDKDNRIHCVTLDPAVEDMVNAHIERTEHGAYLTLPPQTAAKMTDAIRAQIDKTSTPDAQTVILCSPQVRAHVRQMIESSLPAVPVLAYNEIVKGANVESKAVITAEQL